MKMISEHLGEIIIAIIALALLVILVTSMDSPTGGFFDRIISGNDSVSEGFLDSVENAAINVVGGDNWSSESDGAGGNGSSGSGGTDSGDDDNNSEDSDDGGNGTGESGRESTGFTVSLISRVRFNDLGFSPYFANSYWMSCLQDAYQNKSGIVIYVYDDKMGGLYWNEDGMLCNGHWENPLGVTNATALGVYPLSEMTALSTSGSAFGSLNIFYDKSCAENWESFTLSSCYAMDFSVPWSENSAYTLFEKSSLNATWSASQNTMNPGFTYPEGTTYIGGNYLYSAETADAITWQ